MMALATMKTKRIIGIAIAIFVALYVGSYAILSTNGGFVFTQSGKIRLGISLDDQWIWMPRYGWGQKYQWPNGRNTVRVFDAAGWIYLPLILADQAWIHPTQRFITDDGKWIDGFTPPARTLWHHDMIEEQELMKNGQPSVGGDGVPAKRGTLSQGASAPQH